MLGLFSMKKKGTGASAAEEKKDSTTSATDVSSAVPPSTFERTGLGVTHLIPFNIVVFDGNVGHNWCKIFEDLRAKSGATFNVYQCSWNKCMATCYSDGVRLSLAPLHASTGELSDGRTVNVKPDFVLVRNQPRGAIPVTDCRKVLWALMMADVPSMNSWQAIYNNLERPLMVGAMLGIQRKFRKLAAEGKAIGDAKLAAKKFPFIDATYYSCEKQMIIGPSFPAVIKVSHAHAGMGKMKVADMTQFRDVATILAVNDDYCTAEPFIDGSFQFRIQYVCGTYRLMKKVLTGASWHSHFGGAFLEGVGAEGIGEDFKQWADECSKLFGGMDILAIDGIHSKDGDDVLIELNGTAIGILPEWWLEDSIIMAKEVVNRINSIYCA